MRTGNRDRREKGMGYEDLQVLVEQGRKLHSQAVFETIAGTITWLRSLLGHEVSSSLKEDGIMAKP